MPTLTIDQKKGIRKAMLIALDEVGFYTDWKRPEARHPRYSWNRWVQPVSRIRRRNLCLGWRMSPQRYVGSYELADVITDGEVCRTPSGIPCWVRGGTFLVFCKVFESSHSCAWAVRINITPDANPSVVAAAVNAHPWFRKRSI